VSVKKSSGRPATSRTEENIARVHQIVHENHQLTVRSIAEQANIDRETVFLSVWGGPESLGIFVSSP
jgi:hypothetical protein